MWSTTAATCERSTDRSCAGRPADAVFLRVLGRVADVERGGVGVDASVAVLVGVAVADGDGEGVEQPSDLLVVGASV